MMATKDQERAALEQIRKIVEGLGEDSYIGTALEGVLEDAETNIEWDAAFSMKDRYETAEKSAESFRKENADLREKAVALKKELDLARETTRLEAERANGFVEKYREANDKATEHWNNFREQEDKVETLELENMKLKAKLYDMMTAKA